MKKWVPAIVLLVAVGAFALLRERGRVVGLEEWAREHGFVALVPFVPGDAPPSVALATRIHGHAPLRWGGGAEGTVDGVTVTIAEYEVSGTGRTTAWHTLVMWPAAPASDVVTAEQNRARAAWPHEGTLVRDAAWAAWRRDGLISTERLAAVLAQLPAARRALE